MTIRASGSQPDPKELEVLKGLISSSGASGSGRVYMGDYAPKKPKGVTAQTWRQIQEESGREDRSIWMTKEEAEGDYYNWSPKAQADFVAKGILSGMLDLGDGPIEGAALWKKLVKEATNYGKAGKKVGPLDLMASYIQAAGGTGPNAWRQQGVWEVNVETGDRRYVGPGTYLGKGRAQQTDTRIDMTDPDTARAISTKLFQDLMGRDPGAGELSAFAEALRTAEQNNPIVSTTTTQYDMETGQPISSDTQQSGGMTAEGRALIQEQQIKKSKEYGVTQAATTYAGAFESLIFGSPE